VHVERMGEEKKLYKVWWESIDGRLGSERILGRLDGEGGGCKVDPVGSR
jgi:hypothetical protein